MLKWLFTLVLALFLLGAISPHLARFIRFGQLPGDFVFHFKGRRYAFPFATTVILSLLLWLMARIV